MKQYMRAVQSPFLDCYRSVYGPTGLYWIQTHVQPRGSVGVLPLLYALHTYPDAPAKTRTDVTANCGGVKPVPLCAGLPKNCRVEIREVDITEDREGPQAHMLEFQTSMQCTELVGDTGSERRMYGPRPEPGGLWDAYYRMKVATAAGVPLATMGYRDDIEWRRTEIFFLCSATASAGGSIMMQHMLDRADSMGFQLSLLDTTTPIDGKPGFYQQFGFVVNSAHRFRSSDRSLVRPPKTN